MFPHRRWEAAATYFSQLPSDLSPVMTCPQLWPVPGYDLSPAMTCPWLWPVPSYDLSLALMCPQLWPKLWHVPSNDLSTAVTCPWLWHVPSYDMSKLWHVPSYDLSSAMTCPQLQLAFERRAVSLSYHHCNICDVSQWCAIGVWLVSIASDSPSSPRIPCVCSLPRCSSLIGLGSNLVVLWSWRPWSW